jgi:UDPglucose 6-dehydrogenase
MERFRQENAELDVTCCAAPEDVAEDADALIVVTEWPQYRELDWQAVKSSMRTPVLLDGRNLLDREAMTRLGFRYVTLAG